METTIDGFSTLKKIAYTKFHDAQIMMASYTKYAIICESEPKAM